MLVAIKGMEMPSSCAECRFTEHGNIDEFTIWCGLTNARLGNWGNFRTTWHKERRKSCPLVEIPDSPRNPEDAYREDFGGGTP